MLPEIAIRLFGAPAITLNGQPVTGFISNKAPALVYYLATTGRPHTRERVATLLWTNTREIDAKRNLRTLLSNLRTLLGPYLEITRTTVRLKTESLGLLDCARFVAALKAAEQTRADVARRTTLLAEAALLYQGPLLDGFHLRDADAFEEWLYPEREHLQRLALQALNELMAHHAHLGELLPSVNYASRLLSLEPTHEETHRHLMLMFALQGQPSAALAQYRTCQQILRQALDVEPSPETRQLFERIRSGAFNQPAPLAVPLPGPLPAADPLLTPPIAPPPLRHNLPAELSAFVGRTVELQQLQHHCQEPTCRLVTITGLGGVGKTRLALAAAQTMTTALPLLFPAGIWFVALTGLEGSEQVEARLATTIAANLQMPLRGSAPTLELIQALHDKVLLLVLDDFDHLVTATPFLTALLQGARQVKLLVTARIRLNLRGEQVVSLDGLTAPPPPLVTGEMAAVLDAYPATQLFVQRARAVAQPFALDRATAVAIVQICQLVQGLPLGIELAAAWVRLLSCVEIAAEIAHNLDFLENSFTDAPAQQRSLRAVFQASWRLLADAEQQCLRHLALFRGGFTRTAADKIAGATLPRLGRLVDSAFVRRSTPGPTVSPVPATRDGAAAAADAADDLRYELPEVIRQFATEQLTQAGEQARLAARYADYYSSWLAGQRLKLQGAGQSAALRVMGSEIENIRLVWQWSSAHLAAGGLTHLDHSLAALFHFYDMRSWFQEGAAVFAQAATQVAHYRTTATADITATILWAKLQARQGWFVFHVGRPLESRALLEESAITLRALAAVEAIFALNYLGAVLRHMGEFAAAQAYVQEALTLAQHHDDPMSASIALNILGQLASLQGNTQEAQGLLRQALALKRQLGDQWGLTYSLTYLGRIAQATGDYTTAQTLFHESLLIYQAIGDQRGIAFALQNRADTAYAAGQIDAARVHYQESLQIYREMNNRAEASLTLSRLGEATCAAGEYVLAAQQLHEALALAWSVQATPGMLAALLGLAALALATGQPAQAVQPLQLVYQHPASQQAQKQKAEERLAVVARAGATVALNPAALTLERYVEARLEVG